MQELLTVELVPKGQWYDNLRSRLTGKAWDALRHACYEAAGHRCEICGGQGAKWPVECHERWEYDEVNRVQKLVGLIVLCPACHEVKHMGLANVRGRGDIAMAHLMVVNGWTGPMANEHVKAAFATWRQRSAEQWTMDLTWLDGQDTSRSSPARSTGTV